MSAFRFQLTPGLKKTWERSLLLTTCQNGFVYLVSGHNINFQMFGYDLELRDSKQHLLITETTVCLLRKGFVSW